jgi:hypothetical protein
MGLLRVFASSALLTAWMAGCSAADLPPPIDDSDGGPKKGDVSVVPPCSTPAPGCACGDAGAQVSCGIIYRRVGSYISCSPGYYTCGSDGTWSDCEGPSIYDGN